MQEMKVNYNNKEKGTIYEQFLNENPEEDDIDYNMQRVRGGTVSSKAHAHVKTSRQSLNEEKMKFCPKNKGKKAEGNK
jgi:hypothetical protein